MVGNHITHVPSILDVTTLCLHILVLHYRSITLFNALTISLKLYTIHFLFPQYIPPYSPLGCGCLSMLSTHPSTRTWVNTSCPHLGLGTAGHPTTPFQVTHCHHIYFGKYNIFPKTTWNLFSKESAKACLYNNLLCFVTAIKEFLLIWIQGEELILSRAF